MNYIKFNLLKLKKSFLNVIVIIFLKENKQLFEEISNLLGMYVYVKDKINIKLYIILGNEL